jgi:hypothetical protein
MALDAAAALCADDTLDFYAAWAVVARALPRPPAAPLLAARWVGRWRRLGRERGISGV